MWPGQTFDPNPTANPAGVGGFALRARLCVHPVRQVLRYAGAGIAAALGATLIPSAVAASAQPIVARQVPVGPRIALVAPDTVTRGTAATLSAQLTLGPAGVPGRTLIF